MKTVTITMTEEEAEVLAGELQWTILRMQSLCGVPRGSIVTERYETVVSGRGKILKAMTLGEVSKAKGANPAQEPRTEVDPFPLSAYEAGLLERAARLLVDTAEEAMNTPQVAMFNQKTLDALRADREAAWRIGDRLHVFAHQEQK